MSDIEREAAELIEIIEYNASISDVIDWLQKRDARQAPASPVAYLVKQELTERYEVADYRDRGRDPKYYSAPFPVFTHPPAKVPEDVIVAARGYLLSDGPYDWSSVDRAHAVKVLANRGLLTTPTPATTAETEWVKLPHDVVINGGMTFRKGVKLSTFIKAAERWHREAMKQYAGISKEDIQALLATTPPQEQ